MCEENEDGKEDGMGEMPYMRKQNEMKMREDTVLKSFPLFCPKCKQETLIDAKNFLIKVVEETVPDAQTQSLQIARNREE